MRLLIIGIVAAATVSCGAPSPEGSHLFVWAGDRERKASDFLGVIDANPASPRYGAIVASLATGEAERFHTTPNRRCRRTASAGQRLRAGKSWLFDLSEPTAPKILTSFGAKAGFSHPHSYVRLPNDDVLATFQYGEGECRVCARSRLAWPCGRHSRRQAAEQPRR